MEIRISYDSKSYVAVLRSHSERVLSLLDRESYSPTCGCMDRTYWGWKFTDFPGARFQEGLCFLSFLYATPFEGNSFHQSEKLSKWIAGGFDFWAKIQRRTGDFDEAYPYERSLAATSFTTFYLSEAWQFAGGSLPPETADAFRSGLIKAGDWLCRNDETHGFLSNHLAAAAAALCHAHRITGEQRFNERSLYFLNKIFDHQSEEGWYDEYGGADPGYQTHGSFYLARIAQLTSNKAIDESLERSFRFLYHFIHPDRSIGGEYTSRNTQTYYPAAFEMMASRSPIARWIAEEMRPAIFTRSAAGLGTVDIYNLFPLLNNLVFAYQGFQENAECPTVPLGPPDEPGQVYFPSAGLLKVRRHRYDLFVGVHKGGVLKMFDRESREIVLSNSGYIGRLSTGKPLSSQWNDPDREVEIREDQILIKGSFFQTSRPVMDSYKFMAFRAFSITVGRVRKAAYWLKALLVKVLIYRKRTLDLSFERAIAFDDDGIRVTDNIRGPCDDVRELHCEQNFTTIHMGSSRYFVPNELPDIPEDEYWDPVDVSRLREGVERTLRVRLDRGAS